MESPSLPTHTTRSGVKFKIERGTRSSSVQNLGSSRGLLWRCSGGRGWISCRQRFGWTANAIPDGTRVVSVLTSINLDYRGFLANTVAGYAERWGSRGERSRLCWEGRDSPALRNSYFPLALLIRSVGNSPSTFAPATKYGSGLGNGNRSRVVHVPFVFTSRAELWDYPPNGLVRMRWSGWSSFRALLNHALGIIHGSLKMVRL